MKKNKMIIYDDHTTFLVTVSVAWWWWYDVVYWKPNAVDDPSTLALGIVLTVAAVAWMVLASFRRGCAAGQSSHSLTHSLTHSSY